MAKPFITIGMLPFPAQCCLPAVCHATLIQCLPPLSFTWNADYASFVTAPQQVRTAAKQACEARGYEVAVMASILLDADSASADFTCRGAGD